MIYCILHCRGIFSNFLKKSLLFFAHIPEHCRGIFFPDKSFFLKISKYVLFI